jgi:hypothetical protein
LIIGNYATHTHQKVKAWLTKLPRFHIHFTPTSSSWLNMVEHFFADVTGDVICAGSFASVNALVADIKDSRAERNAAPRPYQWKAEGATILNILKRTSIVLDEAKRHAELLGAFRSQYTNAFSATTAK